MLLLLLAALGCATAEELRAPAGAGRAELVARLPWRDGRLRTGGFSGIEVSDDGTSVLLLSDRNYLVTATIRRSEDGRPRRLVMGEVRLLPVLRLSDGARVNDSEGLAQGGDGRLWASYEGVGAVGQIAPDLMATPDLPRQPRLLHNAAYEALAIDAEGRLYTVLERNGDAAAPYRMMRLDGGAWRAAFTFARRGSFLPVGADIGPDGLLYLLERDFTGIGFRSRVRRFGLDGSGEEVLLQTGTGKHGNLEGIAVWRDADGAMRLDLITDDNTYWFQRSELVEYRLTD